MCWFDEGSFQNSKYIIVKDIGSFLINTRLHCTSKESEIKRSSVQLDDLGYTPSYASVLTYIQTLERKDQSRCSLTDRKSSLLIFVLVECSKGSPRCILTKNDKMSIASVLSALEPIVTENLIIDCFKLGKYKEDQNRPVLVKLARPWDAQCILNNRKKLATMPGISIKRDMAPN